MPITPIASLSKLSTLYPPAFAVHRFDVMAPAVEKIGLVLAAQFG